MILVTGASGQLGRLVIASLLEKTEASNIIAAVRNPDSVKDLAEKGVQVRQADYSQPETLVKAFAGVEKLLLISSSEIGQRTPQHTNVINAAKETGVSLIAYTSILKADNTPLALADEHFETEKLLEESGIPHVLLRNGWYSENYVMGLPMALEHGAVLGCAADGKFSTATRADYAEAAAVVLTSNNQAGKVYELAGDAAFTLTEYAAAITEASGKTVVFQNLPEAEFKKMLLGAGLPEGLASLFANSEAGAAIGGLYSDNKSLSALIGRPTTPIMETIKAAL
ncbi:SDR family oxidoreductase [Marinomonas transparens]|uniref:SDR family oxidoreductase n=1 Tax=Marinomonas transparens TaxID=2795388 RepID=A0A934JHY6_9GAMM|nr:SDR family oxidoreductase [Marinomonas transparens]MBJ7536370.1 SDR family oxidoreductase [Marinomonas transparens]